MAAAVLSGIVCGIIGTYIVARRMVFLSGGITHASFGGIGIAYYFGLNPILGALVFAVMSSLGIEWGARKGKIREDSAIGMVWSFGMAVGVIFVYLTPGYAPQPDEFSLRQYPDRDDGGYRRFGGCLVAVLLLLAFCFLRTVMYVAFDAQFARSRGVATGTVSYVMAVLVALAVVFCIRSVGIVLLISLLTVPAVIVNSFTKSFTRMAAWSSVVAVTGNIAGLYLSYVMDIPAGAATIFLLALTLIIIKLLPLRSRKTVAYSENPR